MKEPAQESCVHEKEGLTCTSVTSQYADVSVPFRLKPYAVVGNLTTECCGEPVVALRPCQGLNGSCGCELTITQTVCIRIPLEYGANADVGETTALCRRNSSCAGNAANVCYR